MNFGNSTAVKHIGDQIVSNSYVDEIAEWRQAKEAALLADDGWLTLVGLFWLEEGINSVGSDLGSAVLLPDHLPAEIGAIELNSAEILFRCSPGVEVSVDGVPVNVDDAVVLRSDAHEDGASFITIDTVTFFVIERGEHLGVRVRDLRSPDRETFTGRQWFAIDPAYRLDAAFVPHREPRLIPVMNMVGILEPMENIGTVEFSLNGYALSLEAFPTSNGALWLIFRDETSGITTYGACRYLYAERLPGNRVDLDFNKAVHPPCAFTNYATCPLPPPDNVLPIPIEAGERL